MAHKHRRWQILRGFFNYGFRSLSALCNVCLSLDTSISSLQLSKWWRVGLSAEQSYILHNKLETILEMLKNE